MKIYIAVSEWYFRVDIFNFQQFKFKFDIQNFEF